MDVRELMDKISENLSVRRAFGAAYEREGVLIVPVALIAGGGGGGEGPMAPAAADPDAALAAGAGRGPLEAGDSGGSNVPAKRGAAKSTRAVKAVEAPEAPDGGPPAAQPPTSTGGGFGGVVLPVGVYVVKDEQVRFVPAYDATLMVLAGLGVVRVLARLVRSGRRRRRA